ncbi:alpha/beta fold hydrolase [Methylopila sp. M107]|uniref:alpha/beta fold hydrolase n=1 Tax=Methylopila sp. M107 TaxID=1101190 RepID=UPI0003A58853|nr:alpha/beta fold hydrolase [Methylopila sp. M107]
MAAQRNRAPAGENVSDGPASGAAANTGEPATLKGPDDGDIGRRAAESANGQNLMGDIRVKDLVKVGATLTRQTVKQPLALFKASLGFLGEVGKIAAGESESKPKPDDGRFKDPAWRENPIYSSTMQVYLAACQSTTNYAKQLGLNPAESERAQFWLSQISDALSPTNFLLGNPAALRRARETNGMSVARGAKNLASDVLKRRPIPSQVDESAFQVGGNLAVTPGSVVLRTEMFELIQYAPQTERVRARPILVVPSIVNKYYILDIAPDRSILEHFIKNEQTVFVIVWRNPQKRHNRWGMDDYQDAIEAAVDATRAITKSNDVNLWAVCGAGPAAVALAAHLAAVGQRKINSLLLVVSPLDTQSMKKAPGIGAFTQGGDVATSLVKKRSAKKRISAREFTLLFAMLRSNELIWNYWINNYLMGEQPSRFDVLYWNGDGTGMTAQFNQDFSDFIDSNPFVTPGSMQVRGKSIAAIDDLDIDTYVLGAAKDHLCIWQAVYRSAQLLGPRSQFVLGNSGHIQTIVCPPGNKKASFFTNAELKPTADEWLSTATRHDGSWWDHGVAWTTEHAGELIPAPSSQGDAAHPPLCPAPGTYVHERA